MINIIMYFIEYLKEILKEKTDLKRLLRIYKDPTKCVNRF